MLCINCNKETPDTDLYCHHCGAQLDFTFDQITQKLGKDITTEKTEETEAFFRWILIVVTFFMVTGWLFKGLWDTNIRPRVIPCYAPQIKMPAEPQPTPLVIPEKDPQ